MWVALLPLAVLLPLPLEILPFGRRCLLLVLLFGHRRNLREAAAL
jgi:hypothetical protein